MRSLLCPLVIFVLFFHEIQISFGMEQDPKLLKRELKRLNWLNNSKKMKTEEKAALSRELVAQKQLEMAAREQQRQTVMAAVEEKNRVAKAVKEEKILRKETKKFHSSPSLFTLNSNRHLTSDELQRENRRLKKRLGIDRNIDLNSILHEQHFAGQHLSQTDIGNPHSKYTNPCSNIRVGHQTQYSNSERHTSGTQSARFGRAATQGWSYQNQMVPYGGSGASLGHDPGYNYMQSSSSTFGIPADYELHVNTPGLPGYVPHDNPTGSAAVARLPQFQEDPYQPNFYQQNPYQK